MTATAFLKVSIKRLVGNVARWSGIVSVNYHRIGDGRNSRFDRALWSATEAGFDEQLRWLKANFDVISPEQIPDVVRSRRGRHVVVTFDDGFRDNFTAAYPILRFHRLPAAFFIATGYIDHPRLPWWDQIAWKVRSTLRPMIAMPAYFPTPIEFDEPARYWATRTLLYKYHSLATDQTARFMDDLCAATGVEQLPDSAGEREWMTWDMIREMRAGGMTIGGHTVNHQILARMPREAQAKEISDCGRRLAEELGAPMLTFSYPAGQPDSFNEDSRECLRNVGVRTAFSYYGGFRRLDDWDDHDIRRTAVEQDTTHDAFRASVLAPWWR